jgi:hypothetical protein
MASKVFVGRPPETMAERLENPERVCAECKKRLYRWTPAHPVEGERGVLCTTCWVKGLTSSGPGGIEAAVNSRLTGTESVR